MHPDVRRALEQLWKGLPDDATLEAEEGVTPEAAAVGVVMRVVPAYVRQAMPDDQKRAVLAELRGILAMGFEQAEGYRALPFVANVVHAWIVVQVWEGEGKVEAETRTALLGAIIRALAGKD